MIDETDERHAGTGVATTPTEQDAAQDEPSEGAAGWPAAFLGELADALDRAGVRWVILRNHQDLPDRIGHDVDIIVHPADAETSELVIRGVASRGRLFLVRSYRGIEHLSFDVAARDLTGRLFLHVDIQTSMQFRGRRLVDAEDLLADRRRSGRVWVPSPGMEGYAILLHAGLNKHALKPKYRGRVAAIGLEHPGEIERAATPDLGPDLARRLGAVRTEDELLALTGEVRRAVDGRHRANAWRRPAFEVRSTVTQARLKVRPRGMFVCFLGPDGSGKSSTTDLMEQLLGAQQAVLPVSRVYMGSGTPVLPTRKLTRRMHGIKKDGEGKAQEIRDVAPRRLRGALHVTADEILRYWVHVRPKLSPHGIVLADRYAYDLFRVNNAKVRTTWFRRLATLVIPAPDITFFLEGDPAVIADRKKELTVEETVRQQSAYRELAGFVPNFRPLDLTTRDDAALRRVALQILQAYAARNHGVPLDAAVTITP
jgi:thymidylate kinase